jgi:hypothetical protein
VKFDSTDDRRIDNNPDQKPLSEFDPMSIRYRTLTQDEKNIMASMKIDYEKLFLNLEALGNSKALYIAKTKIQESCMWAVKHIVSSE